MKNISWYSVECGTHVQGSNVCILFYAKLFFFPLVAATTKLCNDIPPTSTYAASSTLYPTVVAATSFHPGFRTKDWSDSASTQFTTAYSTCIFAKFWVYEMWVCHGGKYCAMWHSVLCCLDLQGWVFVPKNIYDTILKKIILFNY
jgi:hypothetical protein